VTTAVPDPNPDVAPDPDPDPDPELIPVVRRPAELIALLDGRDDVVVRIPRSDTEGSCDPGLLLWLAREYGYGFAGSVRFRKWTNTRRHPSASVVTFVRDDSPVAVDRRAETIAQYPHAGRVPDEGDEADRTELEAWRRILTREEYGFRSEAFVPLALAELAALVWVLADVNPFAVAVLLVCTPLLLLHLAGRRHSAARIGAAGFVRVYSPDGWPMYVHKSEAAWFPAGEARHRRTPAA
jgi:hypothetical protein